MASERTQPAQGRFITFEGGEAAGKSTQARLLADGLRAAGREVVLTREPGGSPGAEALRVLLLAGQPEFSPRAETVLHVAARIDHVDQVIRPALEAGQWVVCDRFCDSTRAYQAAGLGVEAGFVEALLGLVGLVPDLTIVLELDAATSRGRLAGRGAGLDRYERLGGDFHGRVADAFGMIAVAEPERCVALDGDAAVETLRQAIWQAVQERLA